MKLIIEISQEDYEKCKKIPDIGVGECLLDNVYNAVKYGKPYEEITNGDIQNAIKQGYNDGFEMAKAKFELFLAQQGKIEQLQKENEQLREERPQGDYDEGYKTGYTDALLEVEELIQRKKKLFGAKIKGGAE